MGPKEEENADQDDSFRFFLGKCISFNNFGDRNYHIDSFDNFEDRNYLAKWNSFDNVEDRNCLSWQMDFF